MGPFNKFHYLAVPLGLLLGTGAYTFHYAKGFSYFSEDPKVCVNCHIMRPQFDSWGKSSHHAAATCVDCHLPHAFPGKYIAKADNGYHHSKGFTLQNFHEPIMITDKNARILQDNCLRCHGDLVHGMGAVPDGSRTRCTHCHDDAGHGETVGMGKFDHTSGG